MRTGAAAGHRGYYHESLCYGSDDELVARLVPFLRGGLAAGEPTVVALGERNGGLVRAALSPAEADRLVFHSGDATYERPAAAIRSYGALLGEYTAAGAGQIRIVGELPTLALGVLWDWWAKYESVINHAYDEYPLWSLCAYDTRITPAGVLRDVAATHRGHDYVEPTEFLTRQRAADVDPLELTSPAVDLTDPTGAETREALRVLNAVGVVSPTALADLMLAATEIVTNAEVHGVPPVRVRCWAGEDRLVVSVTDRGKGPTDPFAGLLPAAHAPMGGLGLWLSHQLCDHVVLRPGDGEFAVRLIAGVPTHRVGA